MLMQILITVAVALTILSSLSPVSFFGDDKSQEVSQALFAKMNKPLAETNWEGR